MLSRLSHLRPSPTRCPPRVRLLRRLHRLPEFSSPQIVAPTFVPKSRKRGCAEQRQRQRCVRKFSPTGLVAVQYCPTSVSALRTVQSTCMNAPSVMFRVWGMSHLAMHPCMRTQSGDGRCAGERASWMYRSGSGRRAAYGWSPVRADRRASLRSRRFSFRFRRLCRLPICRLLLLSPPPSPALSRTAAVWHLLHSLSPRRTCF